MSGCSKFPENYLMREPSYYKKNLSDLMLMLLNPQVDKLDLKVKCFIFSLCLFFNALCLLSFVIYDINFWILYVLSHGLLLKCNQQVAQTIALLHFRIKRAAKKPISLLICIAVATWKHTFFPASKATVTIWTELFWWYDISLCCHGLLLILEKS